MFETVRVSIPDARQVYAQVRRTDAMVVLRAICVKTGTLSKSKTAVRLRAPRARKQAPYPATRHAKTPQQGTNTQSFSRLVSTQCPQTEWCETPFPEPNRHPTPRLWAHPRLHTSSTLCLSSSSPHAAPPLPDQPPVGSSRPSAIVASSRRPGPLRALLKRATTRRYRIRSVRRRARGCPEARAWLHEARTLRCRAALIRRCRALSSRRHCPWRAA